MSSRHLFLLFLLVLMQAPVRADLSNQQLRALWPMWSTRTMDQALNAYGSLAEDRLKPYFAQANVPYPPEKITLLALKEEHRMELWAWHDKAWRHIHDYKIMGASGHIGPKMRQGDKQVPEGVYQITLLNPASRYHLSMKLNYPNATDVKFGQQDGRSNLGGDIFIHGTSYSIGCLAMGNPASEELFMLVNKIGKKAVNVIIAPYDFRQYKPKRRGLDPEWVDGLYAQLQKSMESFPRVKKVTVTSTNPTQTNKMKSGHPEEQLK